MADAFYQQIYAPLTDQQKQLLFLKTNVGGYFFDAVLRAEHQTALKITSHPVQTGANLTDHAYNEPAMLTMEIGMSDVMEGYIPGQFNTLLSVGATAGVSAGLVAGMESRSVTAYQILRQLQTTRMPIQIYTRLALYQNILIENIIAPEDYKTVFGLRATVTFREILVAQVSKTTVSARPQTTGTTNKGTQQPQVVDQGSILYQIENSMK